MPARDGVDWSQLAYQLGLQGLAQEIAVNSIVASFDSGRLCLKMTPELKELVNPGIEKEIQQAIESKLEVSCRLELISQPQLDVETPSQARSREQEEHRLSAIESIKQSDSVKKLKHAFGAELVETSVRKIDE